jgi:hypothetical protein
MQSSTKQLPSVVVLQGDPPLAVTVENAAVAVPVQMSIMPTVVQL